MARPFCSIRPPSSDTWLAKVLTGLDASSDPEAVPRASDPSTLLRDGSKCGVRIGIDG